MTKNLRTINRTQNRIEEIRKRAREFLDKLK